MWRTRARYLLVRDVRLRRTQAHLHAWRSVARAHALRRRWVLKRVLAAWAEEAQDAGKVRGCKHMHELRPH